MARGAPFVLNEKAIIGVVESAFRLIANGGSNPGAAINRSIQALLIEIWRVKTLKKDHVWMLTARWSSATGVPDGRDALRSVDAIIPQKSAEIGEVGFKGIEKWKRFRCANVICISPEAEGVAVMRDREVVDQLESGFPVEIGITTVNARGEGI